jgi:glycosyltransferase involved in cell wall biosynthesis
MLDNEFPPLGGGMGTANYALLKKFETYNDLKIDLITSALKGVFEIEDFSKYIRIYKVPVWNKNIHHSSNLELILYTIQALWHGIKLQRTNHYQFCFAWSTVPAGSVALILHYILRLPYMVWVSGPDIPGFEQRYNNIYPILKPLLRDIWRHAGLVIVKCEEEADMIHNLDSSLDLKIIPNGVDLENFKYKKSYRNNSTLKIVCVARLIERKGQHHLIQAVKILEEEGIDVEVTLVGTGDSQQYLEQLSKDLGIKQKIHFTGYISREEISQYYLDADLFVLPSYNEGMSLAALEAMSSGLPVILSRTGGTYDLVADGVNGYIFDWGDISSLANCIRRIAKNPELIHKMGTISRERAKEFSWTNIAQVYIEIFNNFSS